MIIKEQWEPTWDSMDMSCDNRENDVCVSNTNSIDDLDNHMRSKHGKLIDDLVSNIQPLKLH